MPRAILQQGQIRPLEPLPKDWQDGQPLWVDKAEDGALSIEQIDQDFAKLEVLCSTNDPLEDQKLVDAVQQARKQAKEQVRREMGI